MAGSLVLNLKKQVLLNPIPFTLNCSGTFAATAPLNFTANISVLFACLPASVILAKMGVGGFAHIAAEGVSSYE